MQELENDDDTGTEQSAYAPDTQLPKDLVEVLQQEKQRRQETLVIRKKVQSFFTTWTFHATGVAIAKWCLVYGGSSALWTAASLCFTVSFVPAVFLAQSININYVDGRLEASNMQSLSRLGLGLITASVTTYLAIKDYECLEKLSQQTITQLNDSIQEIQHQYPKSDPWLTIAICSVLFFGSMFIIFTKRDR